MPAIRAELPEPDEHSVQQISEASGLPIIDRSQEQARGEAGIVQGVVVSAARDRDSELPAEQRQAVATKAWPRLSGDAERACVSDGRPIESVQIRGVAHDPHVERSVVRDERGTSRKREQLSADFRPRRGIGNHLGSDAVEMHVERVEVIGVLVDEGREHVDLVAVTHAHGTDLARCGAHRRCLEVDSYPFVLAARRFRLGPERALHLEFTGQATETASRRWTRTRSPSVS